METAGTVLVVDDDESARHALERLFRSTGLVVRSFASAGEFLLNFHPIDDACLLLDLRMPHMGGLELQAELQRRGADLPIIIYTAYADVPTTVQAMQAGAVEVIEKPFSGEQLIRHVREAIARSRAGRGRREAVRQARAGLEMLTSRERQVAKHVVDGLSATEIGARLGISARTVETHRSHVFDKMRVGSAVELAKLLVLGDVEGDPDFE